MWSIENWFTFFKATLLEYSKVGGVSPGIFLESQESLFFSFFKWYFLWILSSYDFSIVSTDWLPLSTTFEISIVSWYKGSWMKYSRLVSFEMSRLSFKFKHKSSWNSLDRMLSVDSVIGIFSERGEWPSYFLLEKGFFCFLVELILDD